MKIKPCPTCGGEVGVELIDEGGGTIYHYGLKPKNEVICVLGGRSYSIEIWNTCPGEDAVRAEALEEAVKAIETWRDGVIHFSGSREYDERVEHWSANCIAAVKDLAKGVGDG